MLSVIGSFTILRDKSDGYLHSRLKTPESCEQYAINIQERSPENAQAARRRAVELRAEKHHATTQADLEALQAVYAYERVLSEASGQKKHANRTWQMIKRRGIIPSVEHLVKQKKPSSGYTALVQIGMQDMAFEAVVLRHPQLFTTEAVMQSNKRMKDWISNPNEP
jgi:uncharacterized protein YecA (UPF0149 family)